MSTYGAEAGTAALKWIPKGGLYITGGLTAKNMDLIQSDIFMDALVDKGRLSDLVKSIPIYAVTTEDLGERGAHRVAIQQYIDLIGNNNKNQSSNEIDKNNNATTSIFFITSIITLTVATAFIFLKNKK
jgi:hypothetical protein